MGLPRGSQQPGVCRSRDELPSELTSLPDGPMRFILPELTAQLAAGEMTTAALAARLGLPPASVRALRSSYAELAPDGKALRTCRGTSCFLNGAGTFERLHESPSSGVYCVGYCDRSPAALRADGGVLLGTADSRQEPSSLPDVRCLAPEPIVLRRILRGDCSLLEGARQAGVYEPLERALRGRPEDLIEALVRSGERGRGGAAFPTGAKWRACRAVESPVRYVVANGDEGDPGSFVDRVLMEHDPHRVLEGLILCGFAVGARDGVVFVRGEYPRAQQVLERAIEDARRAGILGPSVLGSDFAFDVTLFKGLGSYVCGEETALLESLEGRRAEVRPRPPYPVEQGLYGRPTVVNNVETLCNVAAILELGPEAYAALGTDASPGTKVLSLNRGFARPGLVEVEFGLPLQRVVDEAGGGRETAELEALLIGGPMGSVVFREDWDVAVCYGSLAARGIQLGHGGVIAIPRGTDWQALLEHWLEFFAHESCGKCVPCALGSSRALDLARRGPSARGELEPLLELIADTSLCAFGQLVPAPVRTVLRRLAREGGADL